jgi:hypothetical protein
MAKLGITLNASMQNDTVDSTVTGIVDTDMWVFDATTNNASANDIIVSRFGGNEERNVVITGDISSIPSGQAISAATLYLNLGNRTGSVSLTVDAFRCLQAANAAQATWNVYSTGNNWNTAGGQGSGTDRGASADGTNALGTDPSTNAYYSFDITDAATAAYAGDDIIRVLLRLNSSSGNSSCTFRSSQSPVDTFRPEIVVTYDTAPSGVRRKGSLGLLGVGR